MLRDLIDLVVTAVSPKKIILFGSMVHGTTKTAGDIDLLVVMPDGDSCLQLSKAIYRALHEFPYPVDVVVATPAMLKEHQNNIGLIYQTILKEGREIYAA
ncbi:MAG: nucleotidyltransferase domain-containing protein [Acidobacteriota bacterium]|nr:nucleotidyltransferase domain-containing protein [Acidobacteriota bacterium]